MRRVGFGELQARIELVLLALGVAPARAALGARLTAETDRDGVRTHGVARLPRFAQWVRNGLIIHGRGRRGGGVWCDRALDGKAGAGARLLGDAAGDGAGAGAWAGLRGAGGHVALDARGNVWLAGGGRGICGDVLDEHDAESAAVGSKLGGAGEQSAGGGDSAEGDLGDGGRGRVGSDCAGYGDEPVFVWDAGDVFGEGRGLPVPGGFDEQGRLTTDTAAIERTKRALPVGYWKGSGLSFVLDVLAAMLTGGLATHDLPADPAKEVGQSLMGSSQNWLFNG